MKDKLGRNFAALFTASAVSNLGDGIGVVAWPWLASLLTRDPLAIAFVATALRLPWFLFALPSGVITDRIDRRKLVVAMDLARFALLTGLAASLWLSGSANGTPGTGWPSHPLYWILLISALAVGFAEVLRDNAAQTLMPAIVPASRLEAANGRLWSVEVMMNSLIGPPLAGLVLTVAVPLAFAFNGMGFAIAAALVMSIPGNFRPTRAEPKHWVTEMREGAAFLWRNPLLRDLAIGLGVLNAAYLMMQIAMILYSQEVLGLSSTQYGLLLTAGAFGGILGGVLAERVVRLIGTGMALRLTLVTALLQAVVMASIPHAAPIWGAILMAEFTGMVWNTVTVTLRQRLVPQHLLGRVNSVYRFFAWGTMPLGLVVSGLSVKLAEPHMPRAMALTTPFIIAAIILLLLVVLMWKRLSTQAIEGARFE
ncbi:MFS transporter [Agrobacterium sp. a22-2]|uniref:MFS transporter n=1 Tax=Agrobacterium sp. a22-2 TaxID=2283840 RepID=UPI001446BB41|nr:MFS transporter [Agrobacterium sp. a22-2]NKN35374.1 MFS transporter [Agrobacterium sp. a22-2]